jgi:hypothetical protein
VSEDAEVVAVLDVANARDSAMFQTGVQLLLDRATDMKDMLAMVGLELKNVNTVLVAGGYGTSGTMADINQNLMAVVEGGFTKKKMTKVLDGLTGVITKKKRGIKYWITVYGEVAMIGKRLAVTAPGGMPGLIDRAKKKAKGLMKSSKSAGLRAAIAFTDTHHDAWMVTLPPAQTASSLKQFAKVDMVSYSVGATLGSSMTLEVKVQTGSESQAADFSALLTRQAGNAKKMLGQLGLGGVASSFTATHDAAVVQASATLTSDELAKVLGLLEMLNP